MSDKSIIGVSIFIDKKLSSIATAIRTDGFQLKDGELSGWSLLSERDYVNQLFSGPGLQVQNRSMSQIIADYPSFQLIAKTPGPCTFLYDHETKAFVRDAESDKE